MYWWSGSDIAEAAAGDDSDRRVLFVTLWAVSCGTWSQCWTGARNGLHQLPQQILEWRMTLFKHWFCLSKCDGDICMYLYEKWIHWSNTRCLLFRLLNSFMEVFFTFYYFRELRWRYQHVVPARCRGHWWSATDGDRFENKTGAGNPAADTCRAIVYI